MVAAPTKAEHALTRSLRLECRLRQQLLGVLLMLAVMRLDGLSSGATLGPTLAEFEPAARVTLVGALACPPRIEPALLSPTRAG